MSEDDRPQEPQYYTLTYHDTTTSKAMDSAPMYSIQYAGGSEASAEAVAVKLMESPGRIAYVVKVVSRHVSRTSVVVTREAFR